MLHEEMTFHFNFFVIHDSLKLLEEEQIIDNKTFKLPKDYGAITD